MYELILGVIVGVVAGVVLTLGIFAIAVYTLPPIVWQQTETAEVTDVTD